MRLYFTKCDISKKINLQSNVGYKSYIIEITKKHQKIAVNVISQFGEESMKVFEV